MSALLGPDGVVISSSVVEAPSAPAVPGVLDAHYAAQAEYEARAKAAGLKVRAAVKTGAVHSVASSKVVGSAARGFFRGLLGK